MPVKCLYHASGRTVSCTHTHQIRQHTHTHHTTRQDSIPIYAMPGLKPKNNRVPCFFQNAPTAPTTTQGQPQRTHLTPGRGVYIPYPRHYLTGFLCDLKKKPPTLLKFPQNPKSLTYPLPKSPQNQKASALHFPKNKKASSLYLSAW